MYMLICWVLVSMCTLYNTIGHVEIHVVLSFFLLSYSSLPPHLTFILLERGREYIHILSTSRQNSLTILLNPIIHQFAAYTTNHDDSTSRPPSHQIQVAGMTTRDPILILIRGVRSREGDYEIIDIIIVMVVDHTTITMTVEMSTPKEGRLEVLVGVGAVVGWLRV